MDGGHGLYGQQRVGRYSAQTLGNLKVPHPPRRPPAFVFLAIPRFLAERALAGRRPGAHTPASREGIHSRCQLRTAGWKNPLSWYA